MNVLERVPTDRRGQVGALTGAAILWWLLYSLNLPFWDWLLYDVFGMDPDARLTETLHFFFYDTVKIALLLTGIIFVVTVLRSFMSVERTRALLGGRREGIGNVMAAGLGVITPFCSCSAVPAFIGFVAAGVPIGVTLSFLIASPLANEIAIGLLWSPVRLGDRRCCTWSPPSRSRSWPDGSWAGCTWSAGSSRSCSRRRSAARPSTPPPG